MNCRKGDLAVIVRSYAGNEGKIVRCVRLHASQTHDLSGLPFGLSLGPRWVVDRPLPDAFGRPVFAVADACLRPIRDQPGEDETLRIAGLPHSRTPEAA
jgi:hypothetical protein